MGSPKKYSFGMQHIDVDQKFNVVKTTISSVLSQFSSVI